MAGPPQRLHDATGVTQGVGQDLVTATLAKSHRRGKDAQVEIVPESRSAKFGIRRIEQLKAGVNREAVNHLRSDTTTHVRGRLDNDDFTPLLLKDLGGAQTGETGPHDDDVERRTHRTSQLGSRAVIRIHAWLNAKAAEHPAERERATTH